MKNSVKDGDNSLVSTGGSHSIVSGMLVSTLQNDYDNASFVKNFHEINQQDVVNLSATHLLEDIILKNFPNHKDLVRAELGGGSHIGANHYTKLFDASVHIDWVDMSRAMLDEASHVLSHEPEKADKVTLVHKSFIDYLSSISDSSLDVVNMKYCINYLKPDELSLFMDLLHQKLKKGGLFTANYGMRKGILPAVTSTAKFLHNGKALSESAVLKDGDTYTIIFINEQGTPLNTGTTKNFYSKDQLYAAAYGKSNGKDDERFDIFIGSSDLYLPEDKREPLGVMVLHCGLLYLIN